MGQVLTVGIAGQRAEIMNDCAAEPAEKRTALSIGRAAAATGLAFILTALPLAVHGQLQKVARIGVLSGAPPTTHRASSGSDRAWESWDTSRGRRTFLNYAGRRGARTYSLAWLPISSG